MSEFRVLDAAKQFENEVAKVAGETRRSRHNAAWSRPHVSVAAGVHSSQAREFSEDYKSAGIVGAYHRESDGALITESRKALNEVLKFRGMRNNDAGYGDWAGNNS